MKAWVRPLGYALALVLAGIGYYFGFPNRDDNGADAAALLAPDPGYAARDAEVIETGYDGRERYRLNAAVIRQQSDGGVIDLEQLQMDYHPGAQAPVPGEREAPRGDRETWHLTSDRGQVRANGDDVELTGNVVVTGPAPGTQAPLTLTTETMRINTPTEFIETDAPVTVRWSGHELRSRGMQADLKAGTLRLESDVHGEFSPR